MISVPPESQREKSPQKHSWKRDVYLVNLFNKTRVVGPFREVLPASVRSEARKEMFMGPS